MTGVLAQGVSAPVDGHEPPLDVEPIRIGPPDRGAVHRLSVLVLVIGLAVTASLAVASHINYGHTESRLTRLQARLTASALSSAPADIERRLGKAVSLAAAGGGSAATFRREIATSASVPLPFVAAELFAVHDGAVRLITAIGGRPLLAPTSGKQASLLDEAAFPPTPVAGGVVLAVAHVSTGSGQRLGYAIAAQGAKATYVGYAEQVLPANRQVVVPASNPDGDLNVAIFLGHRLDASSLLEMNVPALPVPGSTVSETVRFGTSALTLVVSPRGSLAGPFAEFLALGIAIVGVAMTIGAAAMAERLARRRDMAEHLAAENRRMFQAQRSVSEALQRSLLPQRLPSIPGFETAVRYHPGTDGIEVGGDWYDVVVVDERTVFFTVGDVSGRGLQAAILMGSIRHAINAYALDNAPPHAALEKAGRLIDVVNDGRFATVLCGTLDTRTGEASMANAGHPPPVLVHNGACRLLEGPVGPPLGLGGHYTQTQFSMGVGDTLLAYTDGLIERRGESLSTGLLRLLAAIPPGTPPLDHLLDNVLHTLVPAGPSDDIATLGIRWQS